MHESLNFLPSAVILNLFQDPSCHVIGVGSVNHTMPHGRSKPAATGRAAKWILKQVQDDEKVWADVGINHA